MNVFRFLNVGQGLFYSGRIGVNLNLNNFFYLDCIVGRECCNNPQYLNYQLEKSLLRFVYDCGSTSPNHEEYLTKAIHGDFKQDERVDFVFLSHLHDDHINGFEQLNNFVDVKNVILPYLYDDPLILFTYLVSIYDYNLSENGIDLLLKKYQFYNSLYSKSFEQNNNDNAEISEWHLFSTSNKGFEYYIKNINFKGWKFYLINRKISKSIIDNIREDIKTMVGDLEISSVTSFIEESNTNLKKIKDIYYKNLGKKKMNLSSTVVLHHPINDLSKVSLLTGDAEFDDVMVSIVTTYLKGNNISYLQLPHHGSYSNWKKLKSLKDNSINLFVSYGLGNPYGHPSGKMVKEVHLSGRPLFYSTQSMAFLFPWNEYFI